ncbi:hypothetical protein OQA88_1835 [Cercophora sp. LCS_1]
MEPTPPTGEIPSEEVGTTETTKPKGNTAKTDPTAGKSTGPNPSKDPPETTGKERAVGDELLMRHIKAGDIEAIKLRLRENPGLASDKMGLQQGSLAHYVIQWAKGAEKDKLNMLKAVCTEPENKVKFDEADSHKRTALHMAVLKGYVMVVEWLLKEQHCLPNVPDDRGDFPLLMAFRMREEEKRFQLVKKLLLYRADPNIQNLTQRTALHKAASRGSYQTVQLLLSSKVTVQLLVQYGADIDAKSKTGWTPLHKAASNGALEAVNALIKAGAPTVRYTNSLETPEMLAQAKGYDNVVDAMRQKTDGTVELSGRNLLVSTQTLSTRQVQASKAFEGLIWPSDSHSHETPTVWDMMYQSESKPKLEGLATKGGSKRVHWIHFPGNNDALKFVTTTKEQEASVSNSKTDADMEVAKVREYASHPGRKLNEKEEVHVENLMLLHSSFKSGVQLSSSLDEYFHEFLDKDVLRGRNCDQVVSRFVARDWRRIEKHQESETSDSSDAESEEDLEAGVEEEAMTHGVPIATNAIAPDFLFGKESGGQPGVASANGEETNGYGETPGLATEVKNRETDVGAVRPAAEIHPEAAMDGVGPGEDVATQANDPETHVEAVDQAAGIHSDIATDNVGPGEAPNGRTSLGSIEGEESRPHLEGPVGKELTPGDLESQSLQVSDIEDKPSFWRRHWHWITKNLRASKRTERFLARPEQQDDTDESPSDNEESDDGEESSSNGASRSTMVSSAEYQPPDPTKTTRQQILIVPQIWLWRFGNVIVTSFPERWDRSNGRNLRQAIHERITNRDDQARKDNFGDLTAQDVIEEIVKASLEFEPLFSHSDGQRSYLDAFGSEIAFVSRQITACYETYRKSLGETIKNFEAAIKEETEYLLMIDDILSEIRMIKRVQQDQDRISVAIAGSDAVNFHPAAISVPRPTSSSPKLKDSQSDEDGPLRSAASRHMITNLDRLEEDARRIRKSIISLLDLRQRQATTENAISSSKQSEILFAQSKVLFIFTGATVVFAPLSWVSSLMALKIENFSFETWPQDRAIWALVGSVLTTLLCCIVGWIVYENFDATDAKAAWKKRFTWMGVITDVLAKGNHPPQAPTRVHLPKKQQQPLCLELLLQYGRLFKQPGWVFL